MAVHQTRANETWAAGELVQDDASGVMGAVAKMQAGNTKRHIFPAYG
jgi:hypothetical protein